MHSGQDAPRSMMQAASRANVPRNLSRFRRWAKGLVEAVTVYKKTEITIQTDRLLIIRRRRSTPVWCRECGREVEMVEFSQAAAITGKSQALQPDSAKSYGWHVCEDQNGLPLICLESLLKSR
jgi:hypothetical protein